MANAFRFDVDSVLMFMRLANRLIEAYQVRQLQKLPAVAMGRELIENIWADDSGFEPYFVEAQRLKMAESVVAIASSPDPRMANRERLRNCVLEAATFNVLSFDPPPAEDITGVRGQVGITGELKAHIVEIANRDKDIQRYFHGFQDKPTEASDIAACVAFRGRVCTRWANLYHGLRYVFDDCNKHGKDWYLPFVVAVYAWQEAEYRELLGLPSSIRGHSETDKRMKGLFLSLFVDSVDSGVQYPDLDWNDCLLELEKGNRDWRKETLLDI